MKGKYIKPNGEQVEVLDFDEANKIVRIESGWVGQPEYSTWKKEGEEDTTLYSNEVEIPEVEQVTVEETPEPIVEAPTIEVYEEPIVEIKEEVPETISEVEFNPIVQEENPKKKAAAKKPTVKKEPIKKKKK